MDADAAKLHRHLETWPRDGAAVEDGPHGEAILQLERSRRRADGLLAEARASVAGRLRAWQLFDGAVRRALGLVKRLSYAKSMAALKGSVDLPHILGAKQSVEVTNSIQLLFSLSGATVVIRCSCLTRYKSRVKRTR